MRRIMARSDFDAQSHKLLPVDAKSTIPMAATPISADFEESLPTYGQKTGTFLLRHGWNSHRRAIDETIKDGGKWKGASHGKVIRQLQPGRDQG
jgi:hypothetical protein